MTNLPILDPSSATRDALRGWGPDGAVPAPRDDHRRPRRRFLTR